MTVVLVLALAASILPAAAQGSKKPALAKVEPVEIGAVFPAHTFNNLNVEESGPARIDLGKVIGKKPVVFCYWIPSNRRAEEMLLGLQEALGGEDSRKIAVYAVATVRPGLDAAAIRERAEKIGMRYPILEDEGFRLGQQLVVQMVPHLTILDAEGKVRLVNGGSLRQNLEYRFSVKDAVIRAARTGKLGTYGYLPKYYPAVELVGKECPDFQAPALQDGVVHRWSSLVDPKRLNILVFWSIDCPHCRKTVPEINRWFKQMGSGVNLFGAVRVSNATLKTQTKEFLELNDIKWINLVDQDRKISKDYNVTSTPTIFVVRPDGVVDSVYTSGYTNLVEKFEAKKRQFATSGG